MKTSKDKKNINSNPGVKEYKTLLKNLIDGFRMNITALQQLLLKNDIKGAIKGLDRTIKLLRIIELDEIKFIKKYENISKT